MGSLLLYNKPPNILWLKATTIYIAYETVDKQCRLGSAGSLLVLYELTHTSVVSC